MLNIFIAGDSTAANKSPEARPESGWGEYLESFLVDVKVINVAANGKSSKSFIKDGHLDFIEKCIRKDDLLLIQFGHNDAKIEDPSRYTSPTQTYPKYLMKYIVCAKENGAIPILISSITRRNFKEGMLDPLANQAYPKSMKVFAFKHDIIFIDMFEKSQALIRDLGEMNSKELYMHLSPHTYENYPEGIIDNTHFTPYGAKIFAEIIANDIRKYIR